MSAAKHTPPPVAERPQCPGCGDRLRPQVWHKYVRRDSAGGGFESDKVAEPWDGSYQGYGAFCTLRCATDYANAEFKRTGQRYTRVKATGSAS